MNLTMFQVFLSTSIRLRLALVVNLLHINEIWFGAFDPNWINWFQNYNQNQQPQSQWRTYFTHQSLTFNRFIVKANKKFYMVVQRSATRTFFFNLQPFTAALGLWGATGFQQSFSVPKCICFDFTANISESLKMYLQDIHDRVELEKNKLHFRNQRIEKPRGICSDYV